MRYGLWCPECDDYLRGWIGRIVSFDGISAAQTYADSIMKDNPQAHYIVKFVPANLS